MGKGMAGGGNFGASDGPTDLSTVPNKQFILMVAAFSATGGLLFGYDTGINGGVKVSNDFITAFCVTTYSDPISKCSCYGSTDSPYVFQLAGQKTLVSEIAWVAGEDEIIDSYASGNDEICVGVNDDTKMEEKMWACSCFAPDANRVPPGWLNDKGLFVSLLSFGCALFFFFFFKPAARFVCWAKVCRF